MFKFKKGDKVVCIKDITDSIVWQGLNLTIGKIYIVENVKGKNS